MGHKFHILDVFTKTPFSGNQLAVVMDADDLDVDQMQAITREFGFSETVFLQKSTNSVAVARLRIFTPAQEIPFAGHPTVGTAVLLTELANGYEENNADKLLMLDEGLGAVRAAVTMYGNNHGFAEFDAPQLPQLGVNVPEANEVADALSISIADVGFENHQIISSRAGNKYIFVPVKNISVLRQVKPDFSCWDEAFEQFGQLGVYVYCRDSVGSEGGFHARMFAPALGVLEDPATGSAAIAFAHVIQKFELDDQTYYETQIEQGCEMGRPSQIKLEVELAMRQLRSVRIGGHAVRIGCGDLL